MNHALIAAIVVATAASSADAALITYRVHGNVTGNFMTAGAFASAPIGAPVILQFTVETSTVPSFADPNRNIWDGVPGTITSLKATVDGVLSNVAPDTPTRARIVDDMLLSGGPNYFDQFWVEMPAVGATPDFEFARVVLSSVEPGPAVGSSLAGIDWPTDSSQLNISTFNNEQQLHLRGATLTDNLFASIRSIEVIVPSPGVGAMLSMAGLCIIRRRRPTPDSACAG